MKVGSSQSAFLLANQNEIGCKFKSNKRIIDIANSQQKMWLFAIQCQHQPYSVVNIKYIKLNMHIMLYLYINNIYF